VATQWTATGSRSARAVQSTTESAPSDASVGVPREGLDSIEPVLVAPNGQTFTGAGTLLAYVYLFATGAAAARWVRAPEDDRDLSSLTGLAEGALPAYEVVSKTGLFIWIPSGVGLSGGATVTTDYVCGAGSGRPDV
jgi:hypothetical protein